MATIHAAAKQSKVSLAKFLGLYEAPDGDTQLKHGLAAFMENFEISENYHLRTRPGLRTITTDGRSENNEWVKLKILGMLAGEYSGVPWLLVVLDAKVWLYRPADSFSRTLVTTLTGVGNTRPLLFEFGGCVYCGNGYAYYRLTPSLVGGTLSFSATRVTGYIPLVVTGAAPSGGGTKLEQINLLSNKRRVRYSADGTATDYVLPETPYSIVSVSVNGSALTSGWSLVDGKCRFTTAPAAGTNNVEITYQVGSDEEWANIPILWNNNAAFFNGPTDSRVFLYGAGNAFPNSRHICYYSGVTEAGAPSAEYFPELNQIAVGQSNAPINGMVRHYGRLMVFKADGTYTISRDTLTLADGSTTAGFYVKPANAELGSTVPGQLATVANFPRTFCRGSLYDWKQTASYYLDERYARVCSEPVQFSLRDADESKLFLFDDDTRQRFFCFLNDALGTVLVQDYARDAWYRWTGFFDVHFAARVGTEQRLLLCSGSDAAVSFRLLELSDAVSYDYLPTDESEPGDVTLVQTPIRARWESGHEAFGSESTRKYCSFIWTTLLAGPGAVLKLTARTDRRAEYAVKTSDAATTGLFDATEFDHFSFETYLAPFARRLKLKVKKFVYYKLILESDWERESRTADTFSAAPESDGGTGRVTVLNVDMKLRTASDAK